MRAWLLKVLGLTDAAESAMAAERACQLAQKAARLALEYAQVSQQQSMPSMMAQGGAPQKRKVAIDDDFDA